MKRLFIAITCLTAVLMSACNGGGSGTGSMADVFSPDVVLPSGGSLYVANRAASEIVEVDKDGNTIVKRQKFDSPINAMMMDDGKLWALGDGPKGVLYQINPADLTIAAQTSLGYSPTAIVRNEATGNFWITQRFNDELWEVNPANGEVVAKVAVGREPIAVVSFADGAMMLVANNMLEGAATEFPLCAKMDIVDASSKAVVKRIALPNGSTDVKSMTVDSGKHYAYVTHLLGRYQIPTNQVDRGWMMTNAMSIIDLGTQELLTTVLLDTPQKGASNPHTVVVTGDDKVVAVAIAGTHEVAHIDRVALHDRIDRAKNGEKVVPSLYGFESIPNDAGFLYGIRRFIPTEGNGPRALASDGDKLYAANYFTADIAAIDAATGEMLGAAKYGGALGETELGRGEMYFCDADYCFQQWQSCASCHPNDARVDGLNWDLLNDGAGSLKNTKSLLYSHFTPPTTITGIRADAFISVRKGITHIQFAQTHDSIPAAMDKWLMSLKALPSPCLVEGQLSEAAVRGKVNFDKYCLYCHSGEYYTDMKQYEVGWATGKDAHVKMDVPALTEVWRTAPYLYDGRSYTMREMLDVHGPSDPLSDGELDDMAEYVLSL